nr:glycosyltransferase family 4 protein [Bradyrhizobium tropiciagri]
MRVLLVHNRYKFAGGEDVVVAAEKAMLEDHGHEVSLLDADNAEISGALSKAVAGFTAIYSPAAKRRVADEVARFRPGIMHVHNFFPLLSPSVYCAAHEAGVPVVQTLHNYRLVCPGSQLLRNGSICEQCLGKTAAIHGVVHGCYRGSRAATASVASMLAVHRALGTWGMVDAYIALTRFGRETFIRGGLPPDRLFVKPNFAHSAAATGQGDGGFALFVGRLSVEKGIRPLLGAWKRPGVDLPLKIAGDGPLMAEVQAAARGMANVELLGQVSKDRVADMLRRAQMLIIPSIWYEGFPMVVVEAFAAGVPVIASNIGALGELIDHGRTGLHARPGDAEDLARQVEFLASDEAQRQRMRHAVRREFELHYTAERNCEMLLAIYEQARARLMPSQL